jgi:hypothetical protein
MADSPDQPSQEPDISQLLSQGKQLLEEIKSFRGQAEAQLKESEVSRKKADSEALLAFNAKKACEEHATTIAGVKGTVEADANTIATNKQRSDEVVAAITSAKANLDTDMKAVDGRRKEADQYSLIVEQHLTSITKAAETGATQLKDIEAFQATAEGQAKVATGAATIADQAAKGADSAHERTAKSAADAETLVTVISGHRDSTSQAVSETKALLTDAQASEANLKKILEHLASSDQISTAHEKRVEALGGELQSLIQRVEGLLPGATSAGLASSFNKQRSRFTLPQKQWLWMFVVCIGLLVILAVPSFLSAIGVLRSTDQSWTAAWRNLILRLPIVAPVIWLAIYAGRNYMMSLRMEEDYAYKEAISTSFEGYKREMEKIAASEGGNPTPITILCTNILRAIAERPGRIYEGRQKDINLATEIQELVEKSAEFSKKKLANQ